MRDKMKIDRRGTLSIFLIIIIVYFLFYNFFFLAIVVLSLLLFNENQTINKLIIQLKNGRLEIQREILNEHRDDFQESLEEISRFRDEPEGQDKILQQLERVFLLGYESGKGRNYKIDNIRVFRNENGEITIQYDEI